MSRRAVGPPTSRENFKDRLIERRRAGTGRSTTTGLPAIGVRIRRAVAAIIGLDDESLETKTVLGKAVAQQRLVRFEPLSNFGGAGMHVCAHRAVLDTHRDRHRTEMLGFELQHRLADAIAELESHRLN